MSKTEKASLMCAVTENGHAVVLKATGEMVKWDIKELGVFLDDLGIEKRCKRELGDQWKPGTIFRWDGTIQWIEDETDSDVAYRGSVISQFNLRQLG